MQAVLGGEMQGLLSVSDLYLSCILIVMHLSMVCPTPPTWGWDGIGWRFAIWSIPHSWIRWWCTLPIYRYILNRSDKCPILPVSWGTNSLGIPQLFSHPHPRRIGWDVSLIDALGNWFTSYFAHRLLLWYCSCICMNPVHFYATLSATAMLWFVPVGNKRLKGSTINVWVDSQTHGCTKTKLWRFWVNIIILGMLYIGN